MRLTVAASTFLLVLALAWGPPYDLMVLALAGVLLGVPGMARSEADTPREFKLWFFACVLYAAAIVIAQAASGPVSLWPEVLRVAALLLAIPVCHVAQHRDHVAGWWWGVVAAPILVAASFLASRRPDAGTLLLCCVFGVVALAGIGHFRQYGRAFAFVPLASFLVALFVAWLATSGMDWGALHCPGDEYCPEPVVAWRQGGAVAVVAFFVLLAVPALRFGRDLTHRDRGVRHLARAGMILVVAVAAASIAGPVFSNGVLLTSYAGLVALLHGLMRVEFEASLLATPETRAVSLSATVICKNEADRIEACLVSLAGWVDELIVLDSGSTDGTVDIARRYTEQVYETDWPGYGLQKQRALDRATGDWVLSIDADEVVTRELAQEIDFVLSRAPRESGFHIPWETVAYGRRLDFGNAGRAPLRLFRRADARFSNDAVHEHVILSRGRVGTLHGRLRHESLRSYGHWMQKSAEYAWLGALKRYDKGRRGGGPVIGTLRAIIAFIRIYVLRLGFLDGAVGYLNAVNAGQYAFNKYMGLWTLRRARDARELAESGPRR